MRTALILVLVCAAFATAQVTNPSYIPIWTGREPIKYCIDPSMEQYRPEILNAVWTWTAAAWLPAQETRNCSEPRTIAYRLSNNGGRWGITMSPPPLHPEPVAGDVFVEFSVPWYWPVARPYLASLLAHETGHAMGMGDSYDPADLMYPGITPYKMLSARERRVVACLYQGFCY